MDFLFFLGRFHVLALHLPIGIILVTIALELIARKPEYQALDVAAPFLWAASATTATLTVALGYLHYLEGGFAGASVTLHMITGTSVAAIAVLAWLLRTRMDAVYATARNAIAVVLVVLITLAGHYGGNLTHGSTYLVEYAPAPIRAMAGMEPRRPPVTELAMADPWLDIVRPVLRSRCLSCHNDDRQRGGLNLSTYQATLAGGETAPAVQPGNAEASELYYRITLARDHESFMPAEGKTPLTDMQTQVIGWWIDAGAPVETTLASLDISDDVRLILANLLALGDASVVATSAEPVTVDRAVMDNLFAVGFQARQRSVSDPMLTVSLAHSPAATLTDAHLEALVDASDHVAELNLRQSEVDDAHLGRIAQLLNLTQLSLANNNVTDVGLEALAGIDGLQSLNLVNNSGVTDAGLASLAPLENLNRLYLWQTGVTVTGVRELESLLPDLVANLGVVGSVDYGEPAQLAGTWDISYIAGQGGPKAAAMVLEQDGATATGSFDGIPVSIAIRGADVSFALRMTTPFGDVDEVVYAGTVDGDSIAGSALSGLGNAPWSAVRSGN